MKRDVSLALLGSPEAGGIPIVVPGVRPAKITATRQGGQVLLSWPAGAYVLESTPDLNAPLWTPVAGVTGNSALVSPDAGPVFYRLAPAR